MKRLVKKSCEYQYLNLINNIAKNGTKETGRNGVIYTSIGESMKFSLEKNTLPLLTTKYVPWKVCLKELLWFMNGNTNNKLLKQQNVKIWNDNATREFLDSRKLFNLKEDDLGPVYGHQWRHFNAKYDNCNTNYTGMGIDQLENIINELKSKNKTSRRLIISAWNPEQIDEMALPPCHTMFQFHVTNENKLSCSLYQRSGDVGLGIPFNIASYSFLTHIIANHCNLEAKEFIHFIGNAHIYENHLKKLKKQVKLKPYDFPKINIKTKHKNINNYSLGDIELLDYKYHPKINLDMIA
jgi:thymidylate synthase